MPKIYFDEHRAERYDANSTRARYRHRAHRARVEPTGRAGVYNTIMNLTTQDEQVACFANAAAHLEPGGCFVIEVSTTHVSVWEKA